MARAKLSAKKRRAKEEKQRLRYVKAFGLPKTFTDDPEKMIRAKKLASKIPAKAVKERSGLRKQTRLTDHDNRKTFRFMDLPAEIRRIVYCYLFEGARITLEKTRIVDGHTLTQRAITHTCRATRLDATPSLWEHTTQVFSNTSNHDLDKSIYPKWSLNLRHRRSVPEIHVQGHIVNNMLRLDMPILKLCTNLRVLKLETFLLWSAQKNPISTTQQILTIEDGLNPGFHDLMVKEIHSIFMGRAIKSFFYGPMSERQLRGILGSKKRAFNVILGAEVEVRAPSPYFPGISSWDLVSEFSRYRVNPDNYITGISPGLEPAEDLVGLLVRIVGKAGGRLKSMTIRMMLPRT
jgi:hypothetical protein